MTMRVIGLMSGTSYDAIDVAAAEFDVDEDTLVLRPLGSLGVPYPDELRDAVAAVL
ncbi:MAG: anhydro-N-acetylmuramic acid kinase, partial [Actinocatenispora sp.]